MERVDEDFQAKQNAVSLTRRMMRSGGFDSLYREGMGLIEEVAAYLDSQGRHDAKVLEREASFIYATESMRLTTRLMQLASWLLLQRAVNEGEISPEQALKEKAKVKFSALPSDRGGPGWEELPQALTDFIEKGDRLFERVQTYDRLERGEEVSPTGNPENAVSAQLNRLHSAFGR